MLRANEIMSRQRLTLLLRRTPAITTVRRSFNTSPRVKENTPWYLNIPERKETAQNSPFIKPVAFPQTRVPASVEIVASHLNDKLAVTDIVIFDTAHSNSATSIQNMADFVLIGSVKSFRHLQSCNDELIKFIKNEFNAFPKSEGLVTSGILKKRQRRLGRKTNLGKVPKPETDESGWCLISCNVDGLYVNIMTEERRKDLNLEELYCRQEELDRYRKEESSIDDLKDDDNVLTDLRKLVLKNSKRYYSTIDSGVVPTLAQALIIQDFDTARKLIKVEETPIKTIVSSLGRLPSTIELDHGNWLRLLDEATFIQKHLDDDYWNSRFKFLQLLYVSKRNSILACSKIEQTQLEALNLELNSFVNGFFRFKQTMLCQPTRDELLKFMVLCVKHLEVSESYNQLVAINGWIIRVLRSYEYSDPEVVHDQRVIKLLIKSLYSNEKNLNSLYEYVKLVNNELSNEHLTPEVVKEVLSAFIESESWPTLFRFWKFCITEIGSSNELWTFFIRRLLQKDNQTALAQLMEKGDLIWIHRSKLEIDEDLRLALSDLFRRFEGQYEQTKALLNL